MRILVIDDDEILVDVVTKSLTAQRHVVDAAEDGRLGWEYVEGGEYELILLDIDLPGLDGVSLCAKIRNEGYKVPILLMTAHNATEDRIQGLDAGADDYLTKPLDLGELNARVRALSRRGEVIPTTVLDVNGLTLDPSSCQVSYQDRPIKLTAKEYSLLELFLRNPTRVFSRSQILDKIWTFDDPPLEESVKAHIKGLRKKLKKAGLLDWIENVYGIGYRLNPQLNNSQSSNSSENKANASSIETEFNQKMEQMWLQYQDKMAARMEILQKAAIQLQKTQLEPELHHNAERAAHKLAGVLGMFSRDTGTAIAREIETLFQNNPIFDDCQKSQIISLITDLDSLLGLDDSLTSESAAETAQLLIISEDERLSQELQQLGKASGLGWYRVASIELAKTWLQTHSPYVVGIDLEVAPKSSEYLSSIAELNARTPAIPTFVLSPQDNLSDRVSVTRAGASGFLVKPTTANTVWQTTDRLLKRHQSATTSILIVDDDPIFLATLRAMLEPWGIRVTTLEQPLQFWEVLQAINPDLLILDVEMPEINGIELCQALRSDPDWQDLPTFFLTARQDVQTIEQIFAIGADDYIAKPVVSVELLARINNRLDRSRLLKSLTTQDRLTGLTNRTQSNREIDILLEQARETKQPFCLAVLKMTELTQLNFQYGYALGDRILARWGKIIQAAFRDREVTSYWGNGDFIVAIPDRDKVQSQEHLTEVLTILRKQVFTAPDLTRFQVACSCSIAELTENNSTLHSLYRLCRY